MFRLIILISFIVIIGCGTSSNISKPLSFVENFELETIFEWNSYSLISGLYIGNKIYGARSLNNLIQMWVSPNVPGETYPPWTEIPEALVDSTWANGRFDFPQDLVVANNFIYVSDRTNRIQKFDLSWNYIRKFTHSKIRFPNHIKARNDSIFVLSYGEGISPGGGMLHIITPSGSVSHTVIGGDPGGLALGNDGTIYVSIRDRLKKILPNGTTVWNVGTDWANYNGDPEIGTGDGELLMPKAVVLDGAGHVLVYDSGNDRIACFDLNGVFLANMPVGYKIRDMEFYQGYLYVANATNRTIMKLQLNEL